MADSLRLRILEKIQDVLSTVPDIGEVSGVKKMALNIQSPPAAFIRANEERVIQYLNPNQMDVILDLEIETWIMTQGNLLRAVEDFLARVDETMSQDHTLGGLCIDFQYQGASPPFSLNLEETQAGIALNYSCHYRRAIKDPYSIS